MALPLQKFSGPVLLSRITPLVRDFVQRLRDAGTSREALEAIAELLQHLQGPGWVVLTVIQQELEQEVARVGTPPDGLLVQQKGDGPPPGVRMVVLQRPEIPMQGRIYLQCEREDFWEGIAPLLDLASREVLDLLQKEGGPRTSQIMERMAQGLSQTRSATEIVRVVLSEARTLLNASVALIFLVTPDRKHMQAYVWDGVDDRVVQEDFSLFSLTKPWPVAHAAREGIPLVFETLEALLQAFPEVGAGWEPHIGRACAALPLRTHQDILGTLLLGFSQERPFSGTERLWLDTIAHQVAQAMERTTLQERQDALLHAHESTIAQFRAIMDNAPIGMALFDPQLRCVLINQKLADYGQKTVQEHLGRTLREVYSDY